MIRSLGMGLCQFFRPSRPRIRRPSRFFRAQTICWIGWIQGTMDIGYVLRITVRKIHGGFLPITLGAHSLLMLSCARDPHLIMLLVHRCDFGIRPPTQISNSDLITAYADPAPLHNIGVWPFKVVHGKATGEKLKSTLGKWVRVTYYSDCLRSSCKGAMPLPVTILTTLRCETTDRLPPVHYGVPRSSNHIASIRVTGGLPGKPSLFLRASYRKAEMHDLDSQRYFRIL